MNAFSLRRSQRGLATVEFAIVGAIVMLTTLAVIEFGRLLHTYSMLSEATRRVARVAAVCPPNDPAIAAAANFSDALSVTGFTDANLAITYLDQNGAGTGTFSAIRYVRVSVTAFDYELFLPLPVRTFTITGFPVTVPAESLGLVENLSRNCQG